MAAKAKPKKPIKKAAKKNKAKAKKTAPSVARTFTTASPLGGAIGAKRSRGYTTPLR
jgi:hypothetical protein